MSLSILVACGKSPDAGIAESDEAMKEAVSESQPIKIRESSSGHPWKLSYSMALSKILSTPSRIPLIQADIAEADLSLVACRNFNDLNEKSKKKFYIAFLASIAEAESDFQVAQKTYNPSDRTMNIGMLQIDRASADRHGSDFFDRRFNDNDLKNPELNLMIGALILNNQITGRVATNRLFPERTYYWQVLSGSKRRILKNLKLNLAPMDICKR